MHNELSHKNFSVYLDNPKATNELLIKELDRRHV